MKNIVAHIACLVLLLLSGSTALAQDRRYDEQLDRYQTLCGQCLDLKSRTAVGEEVSRVEAQSLIAAFVSMNKSLKLKLSEMTVLQRRRFADIGNWFTTGNPPEPVLVDLPHVNLIQSVQKVESDIKAPKHSEPSSPQSYPGVRAEFYLLSSYSVPDFSYGLTFGYLHRRFGPYVGFRTNFRTIRTEYSCSSDGIMDTGGRFWPSGVKKRANYSVSAGTLAAVNLWLNLYAGVGYGSRKLAWQDIYGDWALVNDWSHSGLFTECGALFAWRYIALSVGISSISFKTAAFTCGLGLRF